ncbi:MAG TPA: carboxypeptidase-like regulatory domain-containing protein, partial [Burkholderiaceae bacterium]|nr:carboxypeptidase-like regulatory domain-containing protein [Burkholderiaceae bacterium]
LSTQMQADGSLQNETHSIATPLQSRAEAAQTLQMLATLPSALANNINASPERNTQYLARQIISLNASGIDTSRYLTAMLQQQNTDGGFGGSFAYSSDTVNTAWAVLALAQTSQTGGNAAVQARTFLTNQINIDGGVINSTPSSRIYGSAIVLQALETTPDNSNASAISGLNSWLLLQQGGDGSWQSNSFLTAYALLAVTPVGSDASVRTNASNFLLSKQASDGSWNDDPFLTAVILRAISAQPASSTGTTVVQGQVVDSVNKSPLFGATVAVVGGGATTTTDVNGNFTLNNLAAGTISLGFSSTGYSASTRSLTIVAGQAINTGVIGLVQLGSAVIVRGQIIAASSGAPLAGVVVTVTGSGSGSATTDASGRYTITGVTPGAVTITASLTGYQTASGSGTLVAGQTINFAPGLYANGQTAPTGVQYSGSVVAAGQSTPLAGVAVNAVGASGNTSGVTTGAGQFNFVLNPGTYVVTFSLAGYTSVTQTFIGVAGASVNAGVVNLTPVLASSTITGQVLNASNQAIAGATVQVVGTSTVATTAVDGSYTLSNVTGTTISLRASATGFDSQTVNLQLTQSANITQNFALAAQTAGTLSIGALTVTPASVGSNANVKVATTISNSSTTASSAIVQLQILDSTGKLIGTGAAYDANGNQIGQVNVNNGQPVAINLIWNSGQFAPGTYILAVRLVQVGSISRSMPLGVQLAEATSTVSVTGQAHFSGSVSANPPVLQAGTNTAVQISATIKNDGNIPLSAQAMTLSIVNTANNTVVLTMPINSAAAPVNGLQALSFANWTPANGGNYSLVLAASDPTMGNVTGTLYVGDAGSATYTTNKLAVPTGTQTVRGTVQVLGQNVANGTISDPLAPIIKAAIQKAVTYNDATAAQWTRSNRCYGCHIQAQALVGGETNIALTTYNASQRDLIYATIVNRQHQNGAIYEDSDAVESRTATMHGNWALDSYHDQSAVIAMRVLGAQYLTSLQQADGHWDFDRAWLGQWTSAMDHTALNVKSLIGVINTLPKVPAAALATSQTTPYLPSYSQATNGVTIQDNVGNLYITYSGQSSVTQIKPDGTMGMQWTGLNGPGGMVPDKNGNGILVSTGNGLTRLTFDGKSTLLNSDGQLSWLVYGPDGMLYSTSYQTNTIVKIDDSWNVTVFVPNGVITGQGLPAFDASGNLLVPTQQNQIYLVTPAGSVQSLINTEGICNGPRSIVPYGQNWLVGALDGVYVFNSQWRFVQKLSGVHADATVVLSNGNIVVTGYQISGLSQISFGTTDVGAAVAHYAASVDLATQWMLAQSPTDNVALSHQLIGLGEAANYYANNSGKHSTITARMASIAATFRANQNADGSWGTTQGALGDAFVTAHVGYALGYTNPSPTDPVIRNAVTWLLSQQGADGSWNSADHIFTTNVATTTWVSIWLPQALNVIGGIDTDLSVTFPANVAMSNPDTAPASVTPNSDGTSTALWHLIGVTSVGQTVNYDLTLQNMMPGETRPVSTDAHLTFNNTFTNSAVNNPITIPQITASAFLGLGVSTDKPSYSANTLVNITGQVANTATNVSSGSVKFDIYTATNTLVANVGSMPFNNLAGNSSTNLGETWNTGNTASGAGYYVLATLLDSTGAVVSTAKSVFAIASSSSGGGVNTSASVNLTTDKQTYQPTDTVKLSDLLTNVTTNAALNNLSVVTSVVNSSGTPVFTKTETLLQLPAAALKNYAYSLSLNGASSGTYHAGVVVTASDGSTAATASTQFTVASSASTGSGLTGGITLSAQQVLLGTPLAITYSATNGGNSALTGLPLTVSIIDPVAQKVMASFPTTQTIAMGTSYAGSDNWTGAGTVGNNYVAVLSATVGGNPLTLAQTTFTLVAPPIKLGITQGLWNNNTVLVLTACNDHDGDDHGGGDDKSKRHGKDGNHGQGNDGDNDDDDNPPQTVACTAVRYVAIDKALTGLGLAHVMTTNTTAFTFAMRTGLYNTLWIAGDQSQLGDDLSAEVSEVVYNGASLIVDGGSEQSDTDFDALGGVKSRHHTSSNQKVTLSGSFYPTAQTLPTVGTAQSLTVTGSGQAQGSMTTTNGDGDNDSDDKPQTVVALVSNTVGAGRTLIAGFDLGATLSTQATAWNTPLNTAFVALTPTATASLTPGEVLPLQTGIANQANAVAVDVQTMLPVGALYLGSSPNAVFTVSTQTADWDFNLAVAQSNSVYLTMRAPGTGGSYNLQTIVNTVNSSTNTAYGNPVLFPITVT